MRRELSLTFLTFALAAVPAFADQLTLSGCGTGAPITVSSGGATLPCDQSFTSNRTGTPVLTSVTSTETGNLSTGIMGIEAAVIDPPNGSGASINGFAEVSYVFSVSGVTNGTAGFDLSANGTLSGNAYPNGISGCNNGTGACGPVVVELEYGTGDSVYINGVLQPAGRAIIGGGSNNILIDTPITNGTALLNITLFYNVSCILCGESSADFIDPLSITGASAFDANGDPVEANFVSESGFNPNAAPVASTPEPSSLALLGIGLVCIAVVARRRLALLH